jgi:hypothetical protein
MLIRIKQFKTESPTKFHCPFEILVGQDPYFIESQVRLGDALRLNYLGKQLLADYISM